MNKARKQIKTTSKIRNEKKKFRIQYQKTRSFSSLILTVPNQSIHNQIKKWLVILNSKD